MIEQRTKPTILVIGGNGRMGQWFRNFFESRNIPVLVAGRRTVLQNHKLVSKADIIIIAVPIFAIEEVIKRISPYLRKDQLLCDIASLKTLSLKAMKSANCGTLGMHPLFGPSLLSPQGQKIVFCRHHDNAHITFLKTLFQESKMEIIELKASQHDKHMAVIQALPHAVNIAFAKTLENQTLLFAKLQTPLFKLQSLITKRLLEQKPHLIADIQLLNPYFLPILKELQQSISWLVQIIAKQDRQALITSLQRLQKKIGKNADYELYQTNKILSTLEDRYLPVFPSFQEVKSKTSFTIAYLGPEGTNTHQAAEEIFGNSHTKFLAKEMLDDVFLSVLKGEGYFGVVPAENSLHGTVRETFDSLSDSPLQVVGSYTMPIHHCLLSFEKNLEKITTVISHPQALAQCKQWLSIHLPNAKRTAATSTTAALKKPKKGQAYISSSKASEIYHVPILFRDIEDTPENSTRFYVIGKKKQRFSTLSQANTLLFVTIVNRVGILRDILDIFARFGISLNKLESRPSREKIWDYCFYIEVDHTPESKTLKKALSELNKYCTSVRVLGRT